MEIGGIKVTTVNQPLVPKETAPMREIQRVTSSGLVGANLFAD